MHLEEALDLPVRQLLAIMQQRTHTTTYFGIPAIKNPLDWWTYQELIYEIDPDVIVEIGNYEGGTTLALAHLCDLRTRGRVIAVDLRHDRISPLVAAHPRVTLITGPACDVVVDVRRLVEPKDTVMVIEDSSHTYEHTLDVLRLYSPLVTLGSYIIVEDTICHNGLNAGPLPGPFEAMLAFMLNNHRFEIDRGRESFLVTWNPMGYLKRVT